MGASGVVVVYISHRTLHHGQRTGQTRDIKKSNKLHDRDGGMGQRAGVQDARSTEYGSFPLASWLCKMPSPRLHFSCRAGCRRSLMIGALAWRVPRYLDGVPSWHIARLLAAAAIGKRPQRAWPGLPGSGARHR